MLAEYYTSQMARQRLFAIFTFVDTASNFDLVDAFHMRSFNINSLN